MALTSIFVEINMPYGQSPVNFYIKEKTRLISQNHLWLSSTPGHEKLFLQAHKPIIGERHCHPLLYIKRENVYKVTFS